LFFVPGLVLATPITQCNIDHVVYTVVLDEHGAILNIFCPVRFAEKAETLFRLICWERKTLFQLKNKLKKRSLLRTITKRAS